MGRVTAKSVVPTRKGLRIFHAVLRDPSGVLECVWPGQPFLDRTIEVGQTLLVSGPVRFYHGRQMAPREYLILGDAEGDGDALAAGKVLPVYPATEGLSHKVIRGLVDRHLEALIAASPDIIPEPVRLAAGLPALADAFRRCTALRPWPRRSRAGAGWRSTSCWISSSCWCARGRSPSAPAAGSRSR